MNEEKLDSIVAGAIYDFMAWLTTRKEKLILSSADDAAPAACAVRDFLSLRGVSPDCVPQVRDWQMRCSMVNLAQSNPCADALKVLSGAMKDDPMYAWSWHCNIAMAAIDEGAPRDSGNAAAARFMHAAFGVDTSCAPKADADDVLIAG